MALIGILALQGDFAAHAAALERLGVLPLGADVAPRSAAAAREVAPSADLPQHRYFLARGAEDVRRADALILPGGESTTMLKFLEADALWRKLGEAVRRKPCFGTCAGAILLAREVSAPAQRSLAALDIAVERNAYGRQRESSIRLGRLQPPLSGEMEMVFIRAPRIRAVGPGVEILARESGDPVWVRQGAILAATFHPELGSDSRPHRLFLDQVKARDQG